MASEYPSTSGSAHPNLEPRLRVDCDVHPFLSQDWEQDLAPYLSEEWRHRLQPRHLRVGDDERSFPSGYSYPNNIFHPLPGPAVRANLFDRADVPGSDPHIAAQDVLERQRMDRALLLPQPSLYLGQFPDPNLATALAQAVNEWLRVKWLASDSRWKGVITVILQDPDWSVKEIGRLADASGMVGVFVPHGNRILGERSYFPIFEAAARHDLPIVTHVVFGGTFSSGPSFPGGPPLHHLDAKANMWSPFHASLVSVLSAGVFSRFPNLRMGWIEVGFAWLPELMWRLDSLWKSLRQTSPWLTRPPSEDILERCLFTTQPWIEPPNRKHIPAILEMSGASQCLAFSSDYPHWDGDDLDLVAKQIPDAILPAVMGDNAVRFFGERIW